MLKLYNKYPVKELIVHPRCRQDFYKGVPCYEAFDKAYTKSKALLGYNGNVFSVEDYIKISEKYPDVSSIMIGRGAVTNPAIFREIKGGKKITTEEMVEFTDILSERYNSILSSDHFTMHKLKEIWIYMMENFPKEEKILKTVRRTDKLGELLRAVHSLPQLER